MKKHFLYTLLLGAAFSFTACDEDFDDVAAPQAWPQEEAVTIPGFSAAAVESVDLANAGEDVVVFNPQLPPALPEGVVIANYRLEVTPSVAGGGDAPAAPAAGQAKITIPATAEGTVAAKDLQAAVEEFFGKRPVERSMDAVLYADMMQGGQATLLTAASFIIKATPKAPFISSSYYIVGDHCGWDLSGVQKFNHSVKDVYEDPIFTLIFTTTKEESYWKILPQENIDAAQQNPDAFWQQGVVGVATGGDPALEGSLVTANPQAGMIEKAAMYKMTLNMMEYTYKLEKLNFAEYIYEIGNNTDWENAYALHSPAMDGVYHAALYLNGDFKFRSDLSGWEGSGNWGLNADKEEGVLINDGGSGNIPVPQNGFYWVTVNLAELTYLLEPFEKMGIIGDGQPGGWDSDTPMEYDTNEKCWKATGVALIAGKEIKFRSMGTWDLANYGGSLDNLIYNAGNIRVAEEGTFTVKLYLETDGKYYAKLIKE